MAISGVNPEPSPLEGKYYVVAFGGAIFAIVLRTEKKI